MNNHTKAASTANLLAVTLGASASDVHADSIPTADGGRDGVIQFVLTKGDIVRTVTISAGKDRRYEIGNADWETIDAGSTVSAMNNYLMRSFR